MRTQLLLSLIFLFVVSFSCKNQPDKQSSEIKQQGVFKKQLGIEIYDSAVLDIIDPHATFEILAKGFRWSEGPLWVEELQALLFSDVPVNKIYKWSEKDSLSVYLEPAGYTGDENKNFNKGPNGLILDKANNLLICQHGDRRIASMEADLINPQTKFTTIADNWHGKKINSPNDLVMDSAGNIYFTDPPYGRPDRKAGEIDINGVFKVSPEKEVTLLIDSLTRPNGIGLSPDQQTLYLNHSDSKNPVIYKYDIAPDGSLESGKVLFDFKELAKTAKGSPDGLKVHKSGNIFTTGPGGVHVLSPEGKHLALFKTGKATANIAFDSNQNYLYTTTTDLLMRIKLK